MTYSCLQCFEGLWDSQTQGTYSEGNSPFLLLIHELMGAHHGQMLHSFHEQLLSQISEAYLLTEFLNLRFWLRAPHSIHW